MPANADPFLARKDDFQRALLAWYRTSARKLPWRAAPSLYKTVVSEFMLQQTQIKTALPYFERWMRELPGFAALAAAPEARVLKLWEGLGYYTRARNLHKLARALAAMPAPPRTPEAWRELPGIGPYTAAAITSIAFGEHAACVDGNVVRILARLTADATAFNDSASAAKILSPLANALIAGATAPGDHNQAMMELGATVCTRQNPSCIVCPVRGFCAASRAANPEKYPRLAAKKIEAQTVIRLWIERDGAILLHRAAPGARRLAGLCELPSLPDIGIGLGENDLRPENTRLLAVQKRSITRYRIEEKVYALRLDAPLRKHIGAIMDTPQSTLEWARLDTLDHVTFSGPHRRLLEKLLTRG